MRGDAYSRLVLRGHGTFLLLLTALMLVMSTVGTFRGAGPFAFLHPNRLAHVGLFQAYALMMVVGIVLWMGSYDARPLKWDVIGLLAHLPPLLASFIFAGTLEQIDTPSTIPLHGFFILLETSALLYGRLSGRKG